MRGANQNPSHAPDAAEILEACCMDETLLNDKDGLLKAVDSLLGPTQTDAVLAILDSKSIHRLEAPHRSPVILCRSNNNRNEFYFCVHRPGCIEFCSCRSFEEKRKTKSEASTIPCKHLLALKLLALLSDDATCVSVEKYGTVEEFSRAVCRKLSIN